MDKQSMDHVSTLCALGTLAVAPAGLAFGVEEYVPPIRPGTKRKAHSSGTLEPRRVVSQPERLNLNRPQSRSGLPVSLFRRKTFQESEQLSTTSTTSTTSRQSSPFGRQLLQSRGGEDGTSIDTKNGRPMSWLRRMSSIGGSPASSIRPATPSATISTSSDAAMWSSEESHHGPNKLVKRSSSQRFSSANYSQAPALRRPATSHQRTATLQQLTSQPSRRISEHVPTPSPQAKQDHVFMPYFNNGDAGIRGIRSRKRHTSGAFDNSNFRTVSDVPGRRPTLVLGTSIEQRPEAELDDSHEPKQEMSSAPPIRSRLRYSLSNARRGVRRRNVTEPIKQGSFPEAATFTDGTSPISPLSHMSPFEIQLPRGTPSFPGSPFAGSDRVVSAPSGRVRSSKRISTAPSDPNSMNLSSDNDTRVFTDDESYEFQSDTAYDSLATRATVGSHTGLKGPQIETIFDESPPTEPPKDPVRLRDLIARGSLDAGMDQETNGFSGGRGPNVGIGISGWDDVDQDMPDAPLPLQGLETPVKSGGMNEDEDLSTPMTVVRHNRVVDMTSSPPVMSLATTPPDDMEEIRHSVEAMSMDHDDLDWDKTTDTSSTFDEAFGSPELPRHSAKIRSPNLAGMELPAINGHHLNGSIQKRVSAFDYSEQQKFDNNTLNGSSPRPKTVHGKQALDGRGSRAPGRRGPSAHFRSQSVPVNRDPGIEGEAANPVIAKFGTWGLGNKPVSEEWNDDFDFDDDLEDALNQEANDSSKLLGTLRGTIKVPQAIINKQDSVHGQFSQVQEFMLLVEELKRLRAQGIKLDLLDLEPKLWEDAESIINLATLNDDEDDIVPPQSPSLSGFDEFDEDSPQPSRLSSSRSRLEDTKWRDSTPRLSLSNPATPPSGRPRGESLAQAKNFLQNIHESRNGPTSSPAHAEELKPEKLPFDTQDLRKLVEQAGVISKGLKEIIRKAEGLSLSPEKTPQRFQDPDFSKIFIRPEDSPSPTFKKSLLPKSRSANSYLGSPVRNEGDGELSGRIKMMAVV